MEKQLTLITHGLICPSSIGIFEKIFYMQFTLDLYFVLAMLKAICCNFALLTNSLRYLSVVCNKQYSLKL